MAQWADALGAFESSAKIRPHPVTTYNIAYCHRALGQYALAREVFARALAENDAAGGSALADAFVSNSRAFIDEIDRLLAMVTFQLNPPNVLVTVDGRPLAPRSNDGSLFAAGIRPAGPGEAVPVGKFRVLVDPGAHVFTFARAGFADAVVNRTLVAGARIEMKLELDRLPASLRIESTPAGSAVSIDDLDVGVTPVELSRPAGAYRVVVRKSGYEPYATQIELRAGQSADLRAPLKKHDVALTQRWWFWTGAAAVVGGVAVATYALTRGESTTQAPVDGGGLGWAVKLR
jgi:hypothetical protein